MKYRVIPRLDIKGPNLVKGIHFEGLRVLGKPEDFAQYYYEQGADELFFQDAVASLYDRNSLHAIVEKTSSQIFIPLCVGGGLRSVDDIREVLRAGADKIALNTAAIKRPELIREASVSFGSSTIVVSIEAIRRDNGRWEALIEYGRETTGVDAAEWAVRAAELGAGELMVTSIDQEGTGKGFDLELLKTISESVSIPVIAGGGCGNPEDAVRAIDEGRADAVSVAAALHYKTLENLAAQSVNREYELEGNIEFLKTGRGYTNVQPCTIGEIKTTMQRHGLDCRMKASDA
ncbi:imidazole glycerol phosphate synthase subunit HisF [Pseudodesulfovibrio indicus]|uniref:imidazole glycerol-phosphate synthase n=1 Tax=Pseudodesulfovibrio indicus TaxID=1716143 RepID=A0A126QP08_9BACT|nr:imidazole glycerol phosphate synthase cyclase subunit [Pseudodesulfovibrio indicus]AMK11486.1 imidazole glycerol phosphate synthase cyclase subunit [Pseudodesulfovibrio indicus]TDT89886.1 cyclase [Pseudodesulfovibrio indicus]